MSGLGHAQREKSSLPLLLLRLEWQEVKRKEGSGSSKIGGDEGKLTKENVRQSISMLDAVIP